MNNISFIGDLTLSALGSVGNDGDVIPYLRTPAISNDGEQIAFAYAGDIWIVSSEGGDARMITSHDEYDERPRFSPDGTQLAFVSKRTGNGDIYVISLENGDIKRLTYNDSVNVLDCWSPDGKWLYFNSSMEGTAILLTKCHWMGEHQ